MVDWKRMSVPQDAVVIGVRQTVPRVFFELWGAGGNGAGACHVTDVIIIKVQVAVIMHSKMTLPHRMLNILLCAGGVYRCLSMNECTGAKGCNTYVNGYGPA